MMGCCIYCSMPWHVNSTWPAFFSEEGMLLMVDIFYDDAWMKNECSAMLCHVNFNEIDTEFATQSSDQIMFM